MAAPGDRTPGEGASVGTNVHAGAGGSGGGDLFAPVADPRVWRAVLTLYIAAGALFLVNNALGFLNVADAPVIARWQGLTHLHSATLGWITLSVIATTVWFFVGQRRVSDGVAAFVTGLAWLAILAFTGLVASFALAFSQAGAYWQLLPVFGSAAAAAIILAFLFAASQLRHQPVVTAPHLALAGGLFAASLGATLGVLLAARNAGAPDVLGDNWFAHPISMDLYVILAFMGLAEALVVRRAARVRWHGLLQASLIAVAVLIADVSFLAGSEDVAFMVAFPLFLAGALTYFIRAAWRPLRVNPFAGGPAANTFWGGVGLIAFIAIFIVIPEEADHWMEMAFLHLLGIGAATNLVLATQSQATPRSGGWLEPTAAWVMNLGLLAFVAGEALTGRADGAILMGVGVVAAVVAMGARLLRTRAGASAVPGRAPARGVSGE